MSSNCGKKVHIVDYGMGNHWSVKTAVSFLGGEPIISESPKDIEQADKIILPGVGSFRKAMENLRLKKLDTAIYQAVILKKRPILGICLGMQLMGEKGFEDGSSNGLAFYPGVVRRFSLSELGELRLPHIGFNTVLAPDGGTLFKNLGSSLDFYFVHSYRFLPRTQEGTQAYCLYGTKFLAAFEKENIFGVQFHPEKSQTNGLRLLQNFLSA